MATNTVKRALSGKMPVSLDEVLQFIRQELFPVVRELRESFNRIATGPYDLGTLSSGIGVPTAAPSGIRAIYIRLDGGAGSTLYVWEGVAWAAK